MSKELKPCPFCGSKHCSFLKRYELLYYVFCDDCSGRGGYGYTPDEAADEWNRRAEVKDDADAD